jgi:hypothetical protein
MTAYDELKYDERKDMVSTVEERYKLEKINAKFLRLLIAEYRRRLKENESDQ